jgi:hypothetical protein
VVVETGAAGVSVPEPPGPPALPRPHSIELDVAGTSVQLSALLEGLDWKRVRPAKDVSAPLLPG